MIHLVPLLIAIGQTQLGADAPISQAEAFAVMTKVEDAMADTVHVKHLSRPKFESQSNKPLQREDLLDEFSRVATAFERQYKLTPRIQYLDLEHLKLSPQRKPEGLNLIKLGYVDTLSPVVIGPNNTLTPEQFSVAVSYFIERWADRVHLPSIEWSPFLEPNTVPTPPKGAQSSERPGPGPGAPAQPRA